MAGHESCSFKVQLRKIAICVLSFLPFDERLKEFLFDVSSDDFSTIGGLTGKLKRSPLS
jgi:hypothetical protein